jgi:hypothetical protein
MGNASRIVAIMECLLNHAERDGRRIEFTVFAWGAAFKFLTAYQQRGLPFHLIEGESYSFSSIFFLPYIRNSRRLRQHAKKLKPSLILLDSDYHFLAYFGLGCPIVSIGQASNVVDRARENSYRPVLFIERLNFYLREKLDAYVQRRFSNLVLAPCFVPKASTGSRVRNIPLIVRNEYLARSVPAGTSDDILKQDDGKMRVGLFLSGSKIENLKFRKLAESHQLEMFSPEGLSEFHVSSSTDLERFDVAIVQGGLSTISECIARAKFLIVFPIRNHAEQYLNAIAVQNLQLGLLGEASDLEDLPCLLARVAEKKNKFIRSPVDCTGAAIAANILFREMLIDDETQAQR